MTKNSFGTSIGLDVVEISRFKSVVKNKKYSFLKKVFSDLEVTYCLSFKDPSSHFAGIFAAKEAVSKALGVDKFPFAEVEIRHEKSGKPAAYKDGKKLKVSISISHTDTIAAAVAIKLA